ncbi:pentapeptide repeat-containing protein, partial [Tepidiforma sp.]|uniref:pentapeptide repeat-containing protein n=1 Tax=Tepidiforma sp. TaxID=2682230 RepID=UPI002ADD610C
PPPRDPAATPRIDPAIDWYRILGVDPLASREAIRDAIRTLADELFASKPSAEKLTRERQRLRDAWAILGDPKLRAAYDAARAAARDGAAPPGDTGPAFDPRPGHMPAGSRQGPVTVNGHVLEAGRSLAGADLRGADLRGLDLAGCDLSGARLQGADLEAASLRRARLEGADLSGASLRWADLSHAAAEGAILRQADLSHAALAGAVLRRASLAGATLAGAVGPGIDLDYADLARADFTGALITPRLIARGRLEGTVFPDGSIRPRPGAT